jgi:predicted transposase YbfD/YdcC
MAKNLVEHFSIIEDPRRGKVAFELTEILVIVTCALFSEVETFVDIAHWARLKEAWLRRFLRLKNGLPSHDTMNRVFRLLDPKVFATVFAQWVGEAMPSFGQVAIDGKSLRGARRNGQGNPIHLVSAFATEAGLSLAHAPVADKGSELTGVSALLEVLELKGCLISLDAVGCQRELAGQIRKRGADYLFCAKGNQPGLRQAIEDAFADAPEAGAFEQFERGHGRQSARRVETIANIGQVDSALWPDCRTLGRVISLRSEGGKSARPEIRYYISSQLLTPEALADAVRNHWAIENDLHWRLDVMLREDACAVRRDNAPENLAIVRRLILNMLKLDTAHPKKSVRLRRKIAGWDDDERMRVLGLQQI